MGFGSLGPSQISATGECQQDFFRNSQGIPQGPGIQMQKKTQKAHKKISEWYCSSLRGPQHDHSSNIFRSQLPSPPENRSSNQHGTRTAKPRLGFKRRRAMAEGPSFSDGENLKIHASAQVCGCVFLEPFEDVSIQVTWSWSMLRRCHRAWRVVAADQNRSPRLCRI